MQLQQSPFLRLISEQKIQNTLGLMGRPADARLTPKLAQEVCERTGSGAFVDGSIASLGSQYVLGLQARNCRTGELLAVGQMPAARKEDVLSVLSQIASNLRTQVGESLATVKQHDAPLPEVTTSSLEALKAFGAGKKLLYSSGQLSAIPLLKRAVERDPKFASAWALLGRMYAYSGQGDLTIEALTNAWQLRDRASDPEKFFIDANYYIQVKGNAERARQTCELWAQSYPRDNLAFSMLSGIVYNAVGQTEKATEN
jgi:tetratricopeptide (TPR) repeat protein